MYDMQGVIQGGGLPQAPGGMMPGAAPSSGMPPGAPASPDPLKFGIDVCVSGLERLSDEARRLGDEAFSTETLTMATRLRKRQTKRQATMDSAVKQGQAAMILGQM